MPIPTALAVEGADPVRLIALLALPLSLWSQEWRSVKDSAGRIVELDLTSTWVTDADMRKVAALPGLRKLSLSHTRISDLALEPLGQLRNVTELDCSFAEYLTEDAFAHIRGWKKLEKLNLRGTQVTSKVFDHLAQLTALRWLDLSHTRIEDEGFEQLTSLPGLEHLAIGANRLTGSSLLILRQLPSLVSLDVGGIQRVDSGLWGLPLTNENLARLAELKSLRSLNLNGATLADRGIDRPGHPDAERKDLRDLSPLAALTNLEKLDLSRLPVSAESLQPLIRLPKLAGLRLGMTPRIDDSAVPFLLSLTPLKTLYLAGSQITPQAKAQLAASQPKLPPLREQARIQQQWLSRRLHDVLPSLMRKHNVPMWIVMMREYNEDPVFRALVSPTTFAARRRTIYVFHDRGPSAGLERLALGGGDQGGLYTSVRDPDHPSRELYLEAQMAALRKIVAERNPARIAVNTSRTHAFSDGLSSGEREELEAALGPEWTARMVRAELLPLQYLETRLPEMLPYYQDMMRIVHDLIARAFSNEVIVPGTTTTADLVWWLRQQVADRGLGTWFQPSVSVQRKGGAAVREGSGALGRSPDVVIERGDLLHTDFGITAMGLATDTQHMGYVLLEGETDAPPGLQAALRRSNRLQDIVLENLEPGRTGNTALAAILSRMKSEGIDGKIYTHPVGDHGHGAGPLIGLYDRQEGVPGRGDVPIIPNSWYSIELNSTSAVPEWGGQKVTISLEEDAALDAQGKRNWVLRRQERYHLIR
jgi:Leucine-rich repeat (LRR) protein